MKNAPFNPHTWFRYIDDIFMIWTEGLDNLKIRLDQIRSTFDPTYTCRIIVHGCLLGHYLLIFATA